MEDIAKKVNKGWLPPPGVGEMMGSLEKNPGISLDLNLGCFHRPVTKFIEKIGRKSSFYTLGGISAPPGLSIGGVAMSQAYPLCYWSVYSIKMRWHTKFQGNISRNVGDIANKVILGWIPPLGVVKWWDPSRKPLGSDQHALIDL